MLASQDSCNNIKTCTNVGSEQIRSFSADDAQHPDLDTKNVDLLRAWCRRQGRRKDGRGLSYTYFTEATAEELIEVEGVRLESLRPSCPGSCVGEMCSRQASADHSPRGLSSLVRHHSGVVLADNVG